MAVSERLDVISSYLPLANDQPLALCSFPHPSSCRSHGCIPRAFDDGRHARSLSHHGAAFTLPSAMYPAAAAPTSAPSVAPAPEAAPAKSAPAARPLLRPPAPAAPAPRNPGAGLPAPLVALLRDEAGPFLANQEEVAAPEWYAITRGRFVGVVDQYALSAVAISGVGHGARKAYTTQGLALDAFNRALEWGGVQVA
ncbi:hypothetical protein C8R47DRAFT_1228156 [Mycena vitilis]|nr:hypothetical protein C8R47DRAFT_1228156 [Mycena vitilis]